MIINIENIDIPTLLDKPIWQMSGKEFFALTQFANATTTGSVQPAQQRHLCHGVRALAEHLGCSESMIFALRRAGVLDAAVHSRIGKVIIFDGDAARELADAYQRARRGIKVGQTEAGAVECVSRDYLQIK